MRSCQQRLSAAGILLGTCALAVAAPGNDAGDDLMSLDLAALMEVEVTLVSRTPQKQFDTPAAVYVITREQIRRSGLKTIPDLLRLAPGVQVGKIDGNTWAIDIRNAPGRFSSNLLVQMDGRTLYNPLFGGVNWDVQDTYLPDIERIEVIRGPGGTLWGANAVDGIINIVTRSAEHTTGGELQALVGRGDLAHEAGARYGKQLSDKLFGRAYVKTRKLDNGEFLDTDHSNNTLFPPGTGAHDDADLTHAGFRTDWQEKLRSVTLQGDYYDGTSHDVNSSLTSLPGNSDTDVSGGNLLTRWTETLGDGSSVSVQAYYDFTERKDELLKENYRIFDLDTQHSFRLWQQQFTWGAGYRRTEDKVRNIPPGTFTVIPDKRDENLYTAFVQGQFEILPAQLQLTLGNKFEHNDYSGYENQPSGRLLWTINSHHNSWAAVTRAVNTPSRADEDAVLDFGGFVIPIGDKNARAKPMLSREIGYRGQWNRWLAVDISAYWNRYSRVTTSTKEVWGVEINPHINPAENWTLEPWYAYARGRRQQADGSQTGQNRIPNHTAGLSSYWQPAAGWQTDATVLYVDSTDAGAVEFDAYTRLDLHIGWNPVRQWQLDAGLNNLLDAKHGENFDSTKINTGVRRGGYVQGTFRFD